jgi:DNA-directed RNA polymerase subunit RPC12/RpoP
MVDYECRQCRSLFTQKEDAIYHLCRYSHRIMVRPELPRWNWLAGETIAVKLEEA